MNRFEEPINENKDLYHLTGLKQIFEIFEVLHGSDSKIFTLLLYSEYAVLKHAFTLHTHPP